MKRLLATAIFIMAFAAFLNIKTLNAQSEIIISKDRIVNRFPDNLTFHLSLSSSSDIQKIELLYRTSGSTCESAVAQQVIEFSPAKLVSVEWQWDFVRSGILPPGAQVYWQWQVTNSAGDTLLTDEQTYLVTDPRYSWQHLTSGQVELWWHEGDSTFGQTLASIANQSLERLSTSAGVRINGQVWLTIYPTVEELQQVEIRTTEWAGGLAYTKFNSTILAIAPGELDWAADVIPHELGHLVIDAYMFNCKGMWLPTWLNEGLALKAEGEVSQDYIDLVNSALEHDELPPLRTLERGFSSSGDAARLSYGQSGMVVAYLIKEYGSQKMTDLLDEVKSGLIIDKSLQAVYSMDTNGIDAAWRVSLGYAPQSTQVPTSSARTAVPTLALWTSVVRPSPTSTDLPTASSTPPPPSEIPPPSPSPSLPAVAEIELPPSQQQTDISSPNLIIPIAVFGAVLLLIITIILFIILVKKRRRIV